MSVSSVGRSLSPQQQKRLRVADSYSERATEAFASGDFDSAALQYSQALSIEKETLIGTVGADGKTINEHPRIAATYFNLGVTYFSNGEFSEAVNAYNKALNIEISMLAKAEANQSAEELKSSRISSVSTLKSPRRNSKLERRRETAAMTYYNLSLSEQELGLYEDSLEHSLEALKLFRQALGGQHELAKTTEIQVRDLKQTLENEKRKMMNCCCFGVSEQKKMDMRLKDRQVIRSKELKEMKLLTEESKSDLQATHHS
jgi:tetratricopeptide (TPR) repeat protein